MDDDPRQETGSLGCTASAWREVEKRRFPRCLSMGKLGSEICEHGKKGQTRAPSRADVSTATGSIGTGQTRVGRELKELENCVSGDAWRVSRALLEALTVRI